MYALLDFGDLRMEQCTKDEQIKVYYKEETVDDFGMYCNKAYIESINNFFSGIIQENAFDGCWELISAIIPDGVTSIGGYAFADCKNLVNIEIPESVENVGAGAFYDCIKLMNIEVPKNVSHIEAATFMRCNSLTNVEVPQGVTSIKSAAFSHCKSLASITIPDSVINIGYCAFKQCTNLKEIIQKGKIFIVSDEFNNALQNAGIAKEEVW